MDVASMAIPMPVTARQKSIVQNPAATVVTIVAPEKIAIPSISTVLREKRDSRYPVGNPPMPKPKVKIVESRPIVGTEKPNSLRTSELRNGKRYRSAAISEYATSKTQYIAMALLRVPDRLSAALTRVAATWS